MTWSRTVWLALMLSLAGIAGAEDVTPPVRAATPAPVPPPKADGAVRIRASHRVDVIAPGEKVETVLDRMRARNTSGPARQEKPVQNLPVRGPDPRFAPPASGAFQGQDGHGGGGGDHGGGGGGSGPGPGGFDRGDSRPPDRSHR